MFKVGIIGCGTHAKSLVKDLRQTGRADVTAVWNRSPGPGRAAALEWKAQFCETAEALLGSGVDLVAICTPGFAHRDFVEKAAAAGRHIICEKPIALQLDDALAMQEAVERAGVTFMVNFKLRHNPAHRHILEAQSSGRLGRTMSAWYRVWAPSPSSRWIDLEKRGHWRASNELSGGRINEFGGHGINWLLSALGRPKTVYGKALTVTEGFTVDDADHAIIDCERGVGMLEVNRHAGVPADECCGVIGRRGSAFLKDGKGFEQPMDGKLVEVPQVTQVSRYAQFLDCIEHGGRPENGAAEAIDVLRVCLAFNRSTRSGQVEAV